MVDRAASAANRREGKMRLLFIDDEVVELVNDRLARGQFEEAKKNDIFAAYVTFVMSDLSGHATADIFSGSCDNCSAPAIARRGAGPHAAGSFGCSASASRTKGAASEREMVFYRFGD